MADHRELGTIAEDEKASPQTNERDEAAPRHRSMILQRRGTRVSIDHFDPDGVQQLVQQLERVMTQQAEVDPGVAVSRTVTQSSGAAEHPSEPPDFQWAVRYLVSQGEQVGIRRRTLGVMFRDLRVVGKGGAATFQETIGSTLNPIAVAQGIRAAMNPQYFDILNGFEGVVQPGEMLLVLGRPGSGCSTFLKVLANQRYEFAGVHGEVHYDSMSPETIEKSFRGDVIYCPEDDIHFPTMTVGQTLEFASTVRTPRARVSGWSRKEMIRQTTNVVLTVFGLRHARDTVVGDAALRGVSGGEKRRTSLGEAMLSQAKITSWDNSTRGLDSSTALEFGSAVRVATDTFRCTSIVSLYQAGENLYQLFDKVCLLYEGRMAYFGPASQARQYFIDLGYEPLDRQTTPDFLVAVTDPETRVHRRGVPNVPQTPAEFADAFKASDVGKRNRTEMEQYEIARVGKPEIADEYKRSMRGDHASTSLHCSPYMISIPMQIRAVARRQIQIIRGNMLFTIIGTFSFLFQALVVGTTFWETPVETDAFYGRGGVMFFTLIFAALLGMAEIPLLFRRRPVVQRQTRAAQYHPFVEAVGVTLVDIPLAFLDISIFTLIVYFFVGFQRTPEQYFTYLLFIYLLNLVMKVLYRAIAAASPSDQVAQAISGTAMLVLTNYIGFTIPRSSLVKGLRWIMWLNPFRYGFESIMSSEFRTIHAECTNRVPIGPPYADVPLENTVCAAIGAEAGEALVSGSKYLERLFGYAYSNTWRNLGIVLLFLVTNFLALLFFSEFGPGLNAANPVTLYKRGSKPKHLNPAPASNDPEKSVQPETHSVRSIRGVAAETDVVDADTTSAADTPATLTRANTPRNEIFTWRNVCYTVQTAHGPRQLLDKVSGYLIPGRLTALMGESGAGKTTLLNVLAQRVDTGVITGDMLVNGHPLPRDFQMQTGYVQQMDTHLPLPTVREALLFSARLRQPPHIPDSEKEDWVNEVLDMCGLEDYADAIVGTLNVELRKRTTIGVELAARPKLLVFLDEPTSGIDSQSAYRLVSFLRSLADRGQAILCTIHQPSAELMQQFNRILLLRKGGQTVYFGDLGPSSSVMIDYFERNGARRCEPSENPAEYMLEVIGAGATASVEQDWHKIWLDSPERIRVEEEIDRIHADGAVKGAVKAELKSRYATNWLYQVQQNVGRLFTAHSRDPEYIMAKVGLSITGGIVIGVTFMSDDTQQGTQSRLYAIFMVTVLAVPLASLTQLQWIKVREIFEIRERSSRIYDWSALVTAQIIVDYPLNVVSSIIIFICWYWTVGFPGDRAGFTFLILAFAFPAYYQTLGQAVAAMCPTPEIATVIYGILFGQAIGFNGVIQPPKNLSWWKWMYWASPYHYLTEALLGQAIGQREMVCSTIELVPVVPPAGMTCGQYLGPYMSYAGGYVVDLNATDVCQFCSTRTTDQFLNFAFSIYYHLYWRDFGIFFAFVAVNIMFTYALTWLFRVRTGSLIPSFLRRK